MWKTMWDVSQKKDISLVTIYKEPEPDFIYTSLWYFKIEIELKEFYKNLYNLDELTTETIQTWLDLWIISKM